ncbi:HEAT repeat domain-containing protein [Methylomonas sp. AM2-LC]|uniref:HEAT repeat domain-containing protein n=1 Tax=Methylomonas sp. AM2-LC TaxID=3153301 RepID=UPI0032666C6B
MINWILAACGFFLVSAAVNADQEKTTSIRFFSTQVTGAELNLIVYDSNLADVLVVISAKIGIAVHYSVLPAELITASCHASELKQLLNCLLGDQASIVMRYQQDTGSVITPAVTREIWLLQTPVVLGVAKQVPESISNLPRVIDSNTAINHLLEQAKQPEQKAQAISGLALAGEKNDVRVRQLLKEAMTDEKPEVRAQAVFALAKREGDAVQAELSQALLDDSVDVRLMVVDSVGNNTTLLQQAAQDTDPNVRQLANMKLQSFANAN